MKISKQEQTFIIFFIVAAILGVGFFMYVLPNINAIDVNKNHLQSKKSEYTKMQDEIEKGANLKEQIEQAYQESKNLSASFYDDLTTYEADEIIRQFIANGKNITIDGLSVSPFSTSTLSISVFRPTEVTYPLKDDANTIGNNANEEEKEDIEKLPKRVVEEIMKSKNATELSTSSTITIGSIDVSFTAHSDKLENLHEFVDSLNAGIYDESIKGADGKPQRKATYMKSVTFEMSKSADDNSANNNQTAEGADAPQQNVSSDDGYGMQFTVTFYCIKPVSEPQYEEIQ